jgi:hypothetical protein
MQDLDAGSLQGGGQGAVSAIAFRPSGP